MPTLLQINVTANSGSTGRIAEQINVKAQQYGWETYIAYGRDMQACTSNLIHVGNMLQVYEHYAEHRLFDNDGLASRMATIQLIKKIKKINPDIIHLHNIHDHWINYKRLFEYLNKIETPIVWTQHDCWSFTGGCGYFTSLQCSKWEKGCNNCPAKKKHLLIPFVEKTEQHYKLKKQLFSSVKNMTVVPVSYWLKRELDNSFMNVYETRVIYNGIDLDVFRPMDDISGVLNKYGLLNTRYVIGVATIWSERKGFADFCKLSAIVKDKVKIVLVGLQEQQRIEAARHGIIGVPRTENVIEIAALYSGASIVMNLSVEETFGLTTVEGFACGTPVIVYNSTASPELVSPETGIICEPNDIDAVVKAMDLLLSKEKPVSACRARAEQSFNKEDCYLEYIQLYEQLLAEFKS